MDNDTVINEKDTTTSFGINSNGDLVITQGYSKVILEAKEQQLALIIIKNTAPLPHTQD